MIGMKHIPNVFTLLNLLTGTIGVVLAIQGQPHYTAILIGVCVLLDYLDGFFARLLNQRSELGVQLDSLADLVSFGLGSSAIIYHYLSLASASLGTGMIASLLPYSAFLLVVFSALRLARFNISKEQTDGFIGLATPASAMFFASLPLVIEFGTPNAISEIVRAFSENIPALLSSIVIFSGLMVSPLPMFSLKMKSIALKSNEIQIVFLVLVAGMLLVGRVYALPLIILLYILLSIIQFGLHLKIKSR